jgi:hypothetical protein
VSDQNRCTPPWLFALLERTLGVRFGLDAFASARNALCPRYFVAPGVEDPAAAGVDALAQAWRWHTFCNHPWKQTYRVFPYALAQARAHGKLVCVVGPTGCSQRWFHEEVRRCATVLAPNQRIVFYASDGSGPTGGADRDTMVYVFDGRPGHQTMINGGIRGANEGWHLAPLAVQGLVVTAR